MSVKIDVRPGDSYGLLTIVEEAARMYGHHRAFRCKCKCGTIKTISLGVMRSGTTKSCGCFRRKATRTRAATHHMSGSKAYTTWCGMKQRCYCVNQEHYGRYGGRGITVCQSWKDSFASFFGDMGYPPKGKMLDRIDPNGNYEPGNCRWISVKLSSWNTRLLRKTNTSGYAGVSLEKRTGKWRAYCRGNGKPQHLGSFFSKELASLERDIAVLGIRGKHAVLNSGVAL